MSDAIFKTAIGPCCCIGCSELIECLDDAELELIFNGLTDLGACVACDNINGTPIHVSQTLSRGDLVNDCGFHNGLSQTIPFTGDSCGFGTARDFKWAIDRKVISSVAYYSIYVAWLTVTARHVYGINLDTVFGSPADTPVADPVESAKALAAIANICAGAVVELPYFGDNAGGTAQCGVTGSTVTIQKLP